MSKYGNKKTEVDGILFDSKKEASRYGELKLLLKAGHIDDLELQPKFPVIVEEKKICTYVADFSYIDLADREFPLIVEDVKGIKTPVYRLKKKLVEALYGIEIQEV